MITGHFSYIDIIDKGNFQSSSKLVFKLGFALFSNYINNVKNVSVGFLIRRKNTNHFQEILNKDRLDEILPFSSSRSLFCNPLFRERIKLNCEIYVIYDEEVNEISLIRDTFGTIPLYYYQDKNTFTFSTDIATILQYTGSNNTIQLNSHKIASYLTWMSDGDSHSSSTFYNNITAVLPGHFVTASAGKISSQSLISFSPEKWAFMNGLGEFSEEFRHIFGQSVLKKVKGRLVVSSHLSGGLDSSSVSSMIRYVAPQLQLNTLYADTNTELTDESRYATLVSQAISSNHLIVHPPLCGLELLIKNTALYNFPEHMSITPSLQTELIKAACGLNSDILMTGTDGDSIVGHGFEYLDQLVKENQWDLLKLALSNLAETRSGIDRRTNWKSLSAKEKKQTIFRDFFYQRISTTHSFNYAINLLTVANNKFGVPYSELFIKGSKGLINKIKYLNLLPSEIVSKQLKEANKHHLEVTSLPKTQMGGIKDRYKFSFNDVFYNQAIAINEEKFYLAKNNNIELGYPFYNSQLFELSMAVPSQLKFNHGKSRGHLREAMKGILAESVRNRTDKGVFSTYARNAAMQLLLESQDFLRPSNLVWDYVDRSLFNKSLKLFLSEKQPPYIHNRTKFFVTRTIYLSIWLNQI